MAAGCVTPVPYSSSLDLGNPHLYKERLESDLWFFTIILPAEALRFECTSDLGVQGVIQTPTALLGRYAAEEGGGREAARPQGLRLTRPSLRAGCWLSLSQHLRTPPLASETETVAICPFDRHAARGSERQNHRLHVWAAPQSCAGGVEGGPPVGLPPLTSQGRDAGQL